MRRSRLRLEDLDLQCMKREDIDLQCNIDALITATEEDLQIWRTSEPDNPHNIEVVRNELRWRCGTCNAIGGPIFHMDHHDPARAQRGVQTAARPHTLVTVKRFRNLVRTACVLHELPERKT